MCECEMGERVSVCVDCAPSILPHFRHGSFRPLVQCRWCISGRTSKLYGFLVVPSLPLKRCTVVFGDVFLPCALSAGHTFVGTFSFLVGLERWTHVSGDILLGTSYFFCVYSAERVKVAVLLIAV